MKTNPHLAGQIVLTLAALTGTARLAAQALPAAAPAIAAAPVIQFKVEAERSVPIAGGGRLILQRVAQPELPPLPPVVAPPVLTPEQRAARLAARQAAAPMPKATRLLWFHVTVHDDGLSYIEWWPDGGGGPYAAWSRADFRYLSMIQEFNLEQTDTRYLVFPFGFSRPRPGSVPAARPAIPADGPGFVLVKGDSANDRAVAPVTALHRLYEDDFATLKQNWEQLELARAVEAARPPLPPGDVVIRFWPLQSEPVATAVTQTPTPAAR